MAKSAPRIAKYPRKVFSKIGEPGEKPQSAVIGVPTGWHFLLAPIVPVLISVRRIAFVTDRNVYLCRPGFTSKSITVLAKYPLGKTRIDARGRRLIVGDKQFLHRFMNSREKRRLAQVVALANKELQSAEREY
jgi:hypothetical protein